MGSYVQRPTSQDNHVHRPTSTLANDIQKLLVESSIDDVRKSSKHQKLLLRQLSKDKHIFLQTWLNQASDNHVSKTLNILLTFNTHPLPLVAGMFSKSCFHDQLMLLLYN